MMLILKIWFFCFIYDILVKPIIRAVITVILRNSKAGRFVYFYVVHKFIKWGYVDLDEGEEYERRQRLEVGDLMFVKSEAHGDEVTICTELDKETMRYKVSDSYYKILGYYAEKQRGA